MGFLIAAELNLKCGNEVFRKLSWFIFCLVSWVVSDFRMSCTKYLIFFGGGEGGALEVLTVLLWAGSIDICIVHEALWDCRVECCMQSSVVRTTARVCCKCLELQMLKAQNLYEGTNAVPSSSIFLEDAGSRSSDQKKIPGLLGNWQRTPHFIHYAPRAVGVGLFQSTTYTPLLGIC
jgi:hypothetical protein